VDNMTNFTVGELLSDLPEKRALVYADALLFAVYGWRPDKILKMKISSIYHWVKLAKKRMTWGDAYKLHRLLELEKLPLWKKILKIKN